MLKRGSEMSRWQTSWILFVVIAILKPLEVATGGQFFAAYGLFQSSHIYGSAPSEILPDFPPSTGEIRGYRRFHANDSLIGNFIPCSYEDKVCFHYNLLFDPVTDRCEPIGGGGSMQCDLSPNRTELTKGSGRIVGACKEYQDPCPGYRMAFDNRCYRKEVVDDVICGSGARVVRHILSGVECRCFVPARLSVEQPIADGQCRIPDLRFPDTTRSVFYTNPFTRIQGYHSNRTSVNYNKEPTYLKCTPNQAKCFSNNGVWVSGYDGCFPLLRSGPCPEDHIVALDVEAAIQGRAEGICVHERGGCPPGHKRMVFDGLCHEDRAIKIASPGKISRNHFGQYILVPFYYGTGTTLSVKNGDSCLVFLTLVAPGVTERALPKPACAANNREQCFLYEVEAEAPIPEDD